MDYITIFVAMITIEGKRKEGFEGQKAIVIPRQILADRCGKNSIISNLYLTDIGYYPKARFHYRERPNGASQHILIYCDKGEGSVSVSGKEYHISPGEFFIIPREKKHYYSADHENPWTIYWIHFTGTTADSIVSQMVNKGVGYKGVLKYPENSIRLFNEIYEQLERGYGSDNLVYSNMCLSHFLTTFLFNEKFKIPVDLESKDLVDESVEFFKRNIEKTLTLREMAESADFSISYYSFIFKKKTGFPPLEYFNHLKIQKACQYLLFTTVKIKDIAERLGISDPYYFSRAFTRVMGVSPKKYRESRLDKS